MIISVFDIVENIVEKGEIACTSNFSFFHDVFKRLLSQTRQKVLLCGNGLIRTSLQFYHLLKDYSWTSQVDSSKFDKLHNERTPKGNRHCIRTRSSFRGQINCR